MTLLLTRVTPTGVSSASPHPSPEGPPVLSSARAPRRPRLVLAPLLSCTVVIFLWSMLARVSTYARLLPTPGAVAQRLIADSATPALLRAAGITLVEALSGCGCAILLALPLAYALYRSRWISAGVLPLIAVSQAVPSIAIAPLLAIWFGYGYSAIIILCVLSVFFPIVVNTVLGLRSIPPELLDAGRLDGAGHAALLRHIEFPLALPAILAGVRTGFTLSVIGAVVGEFIMGGQGLGARVSLQANAVDVAGLFATIVVLCAMAMSIFGLLVLAERRSAVLCGVSG